MKMELARQFWKICFLIFTVGSVLGATLSVTVLVWVLGHLVDVFPPLADFFNTLINTMQSRR